MSVPNGGPIPEPRSAETPDSTAKGDSTELRALDSYFPEQPKHQSFSDLRNIAQILTNNGYKKWAENPRLYCIFRVLERLGQFDTYLDRTYTDYWIPMHSRAISLSPRLPRGSTVRFSDAQNLILAKSVPSLDDWPYRAQVPFKGPSRNLMPPLKRLAVEERWTVDVVQDRLTGKVATRKLIRKDSPPPAYSRYPELELLREFFHRHLEDYIGCLSTTDSISFFFSPVMDTSLFEFMLGCPRTPESISLLEGWIGCLASAVRHLHKSYIFHCNINPANIFIDGKNVVLANFSHGIKRSTERNSESLSHRDFGPRVFGFAPPPPGSDIRKLGYVYCQMLNYIYGQHPEEWGIYAPGIRPDTSSILEHLRGLSSRIGLLQSGYILSVLEKIFSRPSRLNSLELISHIAKLVEVEPEWCHPCCQNSLSPSSRGGEDPKERIAHHQGHFTDQEIHLLRRELAFDPSNDIEWSSNPRVYIILGRSNRLDMLPTFVDAGVTDFWIPFDNHLLKRFIREPQAREDFSMNQGLVLSQVMEPGKHQHFLDGDHYLQEVKQLGSGGFASVSHCYDPQNGRHVARKLIPRKMQESRAKTDTAIFQKELEVLRRVTAERYHHFVSMVGSYTDPNDFAILLSPVADMNLANYLESTPNPGNLSRWFGCLASALRKLHEMKIRHRDIKPQNCLILDNEILLTDFGISRDWSLDSNPTTSGPATRDPRYCAPEVADWEKRNESADIWSLGCVYLEMYSVLQGKAVKDIRDYFHVTGTKQTMYYRNDAAIVSWLSSLEAGQTGERSLSSIVTTMLLPDPAGRIKAPGLIQNLRALAEDRTHLSMMFCHDCIGQLKETDSTPANPKTPDVPDEMDWEAI